MSNRIQVSIENIGSVKTGPFGAQLHQSDYVKSSGTPIVTVEHLSERGLNHKNLPLVSDTDKNRLKQYVLSTNDIVFSRVGSVDRCSIVSEKENGWLFSGRLLRIRPQKDQVYSPYLVLLFQTEKFKHYMRSVAVGGTMPSLNTQILSKVKICLPPLPEQKAIADTLQTWDTTIEKTEALIAAKEKQFDILTRNHISVRQSSSSWQPNTIGNIFDIKTYSSKSSLIKDEGTYYIVDMGSISRKGNLIKTKKTDTLVDPLNENDLVMPKDDIGGGNIIGKVAIIEKNGAFSCGDHVYRLVLKSNSCDPYFLKYLINCPAINRRLRAKANGTSQLGLGKKDLVKQLIRLPSLQEQREIAELLNTAKREIDTLKTLADHYHTQKRGLMQKLLTGKWRVKI